MKKRKKIAALFTGIIALAGVAIGVIITQGTRESIWHPEQFAIVDGIPCLLQDGLVYQYIREIGWEQVELPQPVKQIVPGDTFCVLFENGRLYSTDQLPQEEELPLTAAFYTEMAQQLLEINETEAFAGVSNAIHSDVLALLQDGTILFPLAGEYRPYTLAEKAVAVSGSYILTQQGSLYYMAENADTPLCICEGQNLTDIVTDVFDRNSCLGLTGSGQVVSFGRSWKRDPYDGSMALAWTSLPTDDWNHVISLAQGQQFALGLTDQGKLQFAGDFEEEATVGIQEQLSRWQHIIAIAAYNTEIYGLQADGNCLSLDINTYLTAE